MLVLLLYKVNHEDIKKAFKMYFSKVSMLGMMFTDVKKAVVDTAQSF